MLHIRDLRFESEELKLRCQKCEQKSVIVLREVFFEKALCSCGSEFFVNAATHVIPLTATEWRHKTAITYGVGKNTDDQPLTLAFINQQMKGK